VLPDAAFLWTSFLATAGRAQVGGFTLSNYTNILTDNYFVELIVSTLQLSAITALGSVFLAYPIAFTLARQRNAWTTALFLIMIAALFTSYILAALGMAVALADSGPLNQALMFLGITREPLHLSNSLFAVAVGMVVGFTPLAVIGLVPACDAVPRVHAEAAHGLGASRWRTFWSVIFPQTRLAVAGVALLNFSIATGAFITPAILGGGRVHVVATEIRQQTLQLLDYPTASTLAVVLILIVLVVVAASLVLTKQRVVYRAGG